MKIGLIGAVSGDDKDTKAVVIGLVKEFGYAAADLCGLVADARV